MRPTLALLGGGRSAWKGLHLNNLPMYFIPFFHFADLPFIGPYFVSFPNLTEALNNRVPIHTDARACTILPNFVGYEIISYHRLDISELLTALPCLLCWLCRIRFMVHNGKSYIPVNVTQDMVGHKLGEFAPTKKRFVYKYV